MKVGSLFSGIGGLERGLERAGMEVVWQVERDPYCQKILAKHWPNVTRYEDVHDVHGRSYCPAVVADAGRKRNERTAGNGDSAAQEVQRTGGAPGTATSETRNSGGDGRAGHGNCSSCLAPVDLICGGFPCQPVSVAGKQKGQDDDRWLWPEFARIVRELRPRYVLAENVPGLLIRGMGDVLRDLSALGYDAEWESIPAAAVGAPHLRYRVFIVAYRRGCEPAQHTSGQGAVPNGERFTAIDATGRQNEQSGAGASSALADAERERGTTGLAGPERETGPGILDDRGTESRRSLAETGLQWWSVEPDVGRVADGVPARVDRLRALGNAVVPQVAEWIGHRIITAR